MVLTIAMIFAFRSDGETPKSLVQLSFKWTGGRKTSITVIENDQITVANDVTDEILVEKSRLIRKYLDLGYEIKSSNSYSAVQNLYFKEQETIYMVK